MTSAIITCAGNHTRFGTNKLLADLCGKPVFIRTIESFTKVKSISEIIVSVRKEHFSIYQKLIKENGLSKVKLTEGGKERFISAYNGVKMCSGTNVLIHDGARPLVSPKLIRKVVQTISEPSAQAVITALRPVTCIKRGREHLVEECLDRSATWVAQTPHAYEKDLILKAYQKAIDSKDFNAMDDSELVFSFNTPIKIVEGEDHNLKITVPTDLTIARCLYKSFKNQEEEK